MVVPEALVVGAVARLVDVEERHDEPRPLVVAADAARGLDVLGVRLGLAEDDHQPEPRDVEADRDHVRGDGAVHTLLDLVEAALQAPPRLGHLVGGARARSAPPPRRSSCGPGRARAPHRRVCARRRP